jgi:hydrogenase/urease accessory protein HupE
VTARLLLALWALVAALAAGGPARADDFEPAYLQIVEREGQTYDVLWKVPALGAGQALRVTPVIPGAAGLGRVHTGYAEGVAVKRWRVRVDGGLEGRTIVFTGLSEARIDVLARLTRADGSVQLERVLAYDPRFVVEASPGRFEVMRTYTVLGIEHILLGFDHLCFVLALVLIVRGTRRLVLTVTTFTLAHSVTLVLATLEVIHVPGPPVEAVIALSIVFVASEILQQRRGREGLAARQPWLMAAGFGLLHGLGFAGALAEVGLPANAIPLALLFFNVGVEIGQLLFIACVLAIGRLVPLLVAGRMDLRPAGVAIPYLIGTVASFWAIERVVGFWS